MFPYLFVYLTYQNGLQNVSKKVRSSQVPLSEATPFMVFPPGIAKANIESSDYPKAVFVYHDCKFSFFVENLVRIAPKYDVVFVGWHHGGSITGEQLANDLLDGKLKPSDGAHIPDDPLYLSAVNFIIGDEYAYQKALVQFAGNPLLDELIYLVKHLEMIKRKLVKWDNMRLEKELSRLDDDEKINLVEDRLNKISADLTKQEFEQAILALREEIKKLKLGE